MSSFLNYRNCLTFLSILVALLAICVYIIHNSAPYLLLECVVIGLNCPIPKSYETIKSDLVYISPLKQIMHSWIRNGHSIATQLSIFVDNKEILNLMVKDETKYPNFTQNSLLPTFSTSKTFAALFMAIAVQNKWIKSYNDYITDYWPEFPTKKLTVSINDYLKFHEKYSAKTHFLNLTMDNFMSFNLDKIKIDNKPYYVRIKDLLRHESGFCLMLSNDEIIMNKTTNKEMKRMIEKHKYLIYFAESIRCYHAWSYGYLLNQIFMNVEPKHRSMSNYYNDEIKPKLLETNSKNEFFWTFDGLKNDPKLISKMYHITGPPSYWMLYHVIFPMMMGRENPLNNEFEKQIYPLFMSEDLRPNASILYFDKMMKHGFKLKFGIYPDWDMMDSFSFSKTFMDKLGMAHMSISGVGNAHSISKTASYLLFNGEILNENMINKIISKPKYSLDIFTQLNVVFSKGGFCEFNFSNVYWYGWTGGGGSFMLFSPKYKAVVSSTVSSMISPYYSSHQEPRLDIIMNLVSEQLVNDKI